MADRGRTSSPPFDGEASEGEPAPLAGEIPPAPRLALAGERGTGFRCDFGVLIPARALDRLGAATAFAALAFGGHAPGSPLLSICWANSSARV